MLKKTVTYKDFNDVEQTDDLFFNLTKTELLELQADFNGRLVEELSDVLGSGNQRRILDAFKQIVLKAYGMKTSDGRRFIKEDPDGRSIAADFTQTMAYDAFMIDLLSGGAAGAADFVNSIMPASLVSQLPSADDVLEQTQKLMDEGKIDEVKQILVGDTKGVPVNDETIPPLTQGRLGAPAQEPSQYDLDNMSQEELLAYVKSTRN